jgi:hypothetical protein
MTYQQRIDCAELEVDTDLATQSAMNFIDDQRYAGIYLVALKIERGASAAEEGQLLNDRDAIARIAQQRAGSKSSDTAADDCYVALILLHLAFHHRATLRIWHSPGTRART